ncbi:MAG: hypothetical protein K2Q18_00350 [Bdellovibrionales bacterium]|nr:hypothetical protein [Bdellovibrionales bacterium]
MNNNTENDLGINSKLDNNSHVQSHLNKEDNEMEVALLKKTAKLAKLNLLITVLGLGTLGYLHFSDKGSIDESLAKTKASIKQEIGKELASKEDLQNLSTDLTVKVDGLGARISGLEVQGELYQEEFHKGAQLYARVNELQASMKRSQPAAKSKATESTKSKSKGKVVPKAVKKGKK